MEDKKVIIVTGANSGIGLETAEGLCELGHDVIVSVRDEVKGEAVMREIKAKVPNAKVMYLTMELSDPKSIRDFVDKFHSTGKRLNVLINNAGLYKNGKERFTARNDSALEITMAVNCMGAFLLTNLLLDDLKSSATEASPSRIVNVSSMITVHERASRRGGFYIEDLMLVEEGHYLDGGQAYRNSKLALNLWSRELSKSLQGCHVTVNTVCPGFIPSTNIAKEMKEGFVGAMVMKILDSFLGRKLAGTVPVSEGKRRLIKMSVGNDVTETGLFYSDDKISEEAGEVLDKANQEKIWALCVKYSGL